MFLACLASLFVTLRRLIRSPPDLHESHHNMWGDSLCAIKKDRNAWCVPEKVQRSSALLLQLFCALHATAVSLGSNAVKLLV